MGSRYIELFLARLDDIGRRDGGSGGSTSSFSHGEERLTSTTVPSAPIRGVMMKMQGIPFRASKQDITSFFAYERLLCVCMVLALNLSLLCTAVTT